MNIKLYFLVNWLFGNAIEALKGQVII